MFNAYAKILVECKVKTKIVCAHTGKVISERPWAKNLVLDQGLNSLAGETTFGLQCAPTSGFNFCQVGSSTTPVKISSGAITFTQAATTLTSSGGFFTAGMVGSIFKWGTGSGGNEVYITGFTNTTTVTVGTSATVAVPDVGVIWNVQQTSLQTPLYSTGTFQTNVGDCETTFAGNIVTHKRTFIFPLQGAPYSVNEIGWNPITGTTRCLGRIVLSSTDVVGTSNFYVVVMAISYTYSPSAPSAVSDVGININSAGNAMIEWFSISSINPATGGTLTATDVGGLDSFALNKVGFYTLTYTQNASIPSGLVPTLTIGGTAVNVTPAVGWSKVGGSLGKMRCSPNAVSGSATGQTVYGMGLFSFTSTNAFLNKPYFDIKFTTPQTLPNGTFLPQSTWEFTYSRTLTN